MKKQNKTPKIFLSYSWKNKEEASIIEKDFSEIGIPLIKDTLHLKFKDSISEYMESIRESDFALMLISKDYLQSVNCMYEALEILKEKNHKEKMLPILLNNTKIFTASDRIEFIKYWKDKKEELSKKLEEIDVTSSIDSYNDLKLIDTIYSSIDSFLKKIGDFKTASLDELKKENYRSIIEYLGFEDVSYLIDLLMISRIENATLRETALTNHINKFGISYSALFYKAKIKTDFGFYEEAKQLYRRLLKLNDKDFVALNNYGFLLYQRFNKINKAIECYKKALEISPNLIVARLNLAYAYTRQNKKRKAEKEYLKILKINPYESKAHNNLALIYLENNNKDKTIYHFNEAIKYDPGYVEAYINFANYLGNQSEYKKAEIYFDIAKKAANNKDLNEIVDMLKKVMDKRKNK